MLRGPHGHILGEKPRDSRILEKQEASVRPVYRRDMGCRSTQETPRPTFLYNTIEQI